MSAHRLSHKDIRDISAFLLELNAERRFDQLPSVMLDGLARLIPCENSGYNEIDSNTHKRLIHLRPASPEIVQRFPVLEAHFSEHPQLNYYLANSDRSPYRFSDFISHRNFRNLGIYCEFYRHIEVEYQLVCLLSEQGASRDIGIAINRKLKDFSNRDKAVFEFLRPHLIQARRNALAFTESHHTFEAFNAATAEVDVGVTVLARDGQLKWATPTAIELLDKYFPKALRNANQLPEPLDRWVRQHLLQLANKTAPAQVLEPLWISMEASSLQVRLAPSFSDDHRLLLREELKSHLQEWLHSKGFTQRESEVMHWMVEGKTNPEIALILGTSRRTIHKHAERIFAKLGVHTRSAAVREALSRGGRPTL